MSMGTEMTAEATIADNAAFKPLFDNGAWVWEKHYPKGINWKLPITPKPLYSILDTAVQKFGAQHICDFMGKPSTYNEIHQLTNRAAAGLQKLGVGKGVKVGLMLPNTPYSLIFYFGVLKAGGTVVNFNPLYVDQELRNQITDSETDIMVTVDLKLTCDKMTKMLAETRLKKVVLCGFADALPFPKNMLFPLAKAKDVAKGPFDDRYVPFKQLVDNQGDFKPATIDPANDIAVLQYTGGTTGIPKGAMLTHANIYANTMQVSEWMKPVFDAGKDTIIGVIPLFHVFAMTVVMCCSIEAGMKIILHPKFVVKDVLKSIKKHRPTFFPAVPAIFNAIANSPDVSDYDFSCLKFCISGGAPLPADVKRLFEEKTGCMALAEGYGLTESSPGATFNPAVGVRKVNSIGMPVPCTTIEIIDKDTGKILGVGEKGEVCIIGPQVMKGYFNKPEDTADVLKNGRLHTGDVGYVDDEGYVYLVDRIKDMIMVRGYKVFPRYVEEAIYKHPAVEECIVAGVPDAERGETVWAWIKQRNGQSVDDASLRKFLEDKISPIEMPRKIIFREKALPKTAVGKLSRKDLLIEEGIKK